MKITDVFGRGHTPKGKGDHAYRACLKDQRGGALVKAFGQTQNDADAALLSLLREPFRGHYQPLCLVFRGSIVLIWRDGSQWVYGFVHECAAPSGITIGGWTTREEVERVARLHLAHNEWDEVEMTSPILLHPQDQQDFAAWSIEEKRRRGLWRLLHARGWTNQESFLIMDGIYQQLDSARIQALGDPRSLVQAFAAAPELGQQVSAGDEVNAALAHLSSLFQALHAHVTSMEDNVAMLAQTNHVVPAFDQLCHQLERDCAGLQSGLAALREIVDLLPVHAVIIRLFPSYRDFLDEQQLWELEVVARKAYESRLALPGGNEDLAYDAAHTACIETALKHLGGQDLFSLPDNVCLLIQGVLEQVRLLLQRR